MTIATMADGINSLNQVIPLIIDAL